MNERSAAIPAVEGTIQSDPFDNLPVAYVEMDVHGKITSTNRQTRSLHSEHAGELIGTVPWELMPAEEQELSRAAFMAVLQAEADPPPVRRSVFTSSGSFRILELHRNIIRNAAGQPTGMRVVSVDVTESHQAEQEARRARVWLESVLAAMADAVIVTDSLGLIRTVNPAAEKLFGWKAAELKGKVIEQALPVLCYASRDKTQGSFKLALHKRVRGVAMILDHQRREVRVEIGSSPILDNEHGGTVGVVNVLRRVEEAAWEGHRTPRSWGGHDCAR